ncbi:hypothetical protein [Pseudonocardia abyssalis]|uniref:Uncharacterized protein n=1 Tax=Pseudonocardia abyssalis TaxID=2792008 RepID=A0ABS6UYA3_9PSEU|nr:hypothetical protein [Pseudonocardia abyssalis]MBW0116737.1 hypothetical protein [Pseudonocardia abyssalis]MBW0137239.1 hypothetical protein [Pseudonocardia abyssalis]
MADRWNNDELVDVLTILRALVDGIDSGTCSATNAQRAHVAAAAEVVCQLAASTSTDGRRP